MALDPNSAVVLAAIVAAVASIGASVISAWALVKSTSNNLILAKIAPQIDKVEKQTNHMQEVMQAQATTLGQNEERLNPTEPGTPSPALGITTRDHL